MCAHRLRTCIVRPRQCTYATHTSFKAMLKVCLPSSVCRMSGAWLGSYVDTYASSISFSLNFCCFQICICIFFDFTWMNFTVSRRMSYTKLLCMHTDNTYMVRQTLLYTFYIFACVCVSRKENNRKLMENKRFKCNEAVFVWYSNSSSYSGCIYRNVFLFSFHMIVNTYLIVIIELHL